MTSYKLHCNFTLYSGIVLVLALAHSPSSGQRKLNIAPLIFDGQWLAAVMQIVVMGCFVIWTNQGPVLWPCD